MTRTGGMRSRSGYVHGQSCSAQARPGCTQISSKTERGDYVRCGLVCRRRGLGRATGRVNARPLGAALEVGPAPGARSRARERATLGCSPQSGPGATRTRDLLLRRQALYPTELRTLMWEGKLAS